MTATASITKTKTAKDLDLSEGRAGFRRQRRTAWAEEQTSLLHKVRTIVIIVRIVTIARTDLEITRTLMQMRGYLEEDPSRHQLRYLGMLDPQTGLRVPDLARSREPGTKTP